MPGPAAFEELGNTNPKLRALGSSGQSSKLLDLQVPDFVSYMDYRLNSFS